MLNLLDNAVKYSVEGSEIEIQTCLDDSEVIVMVKDRGLGVTAKDLPHLFDKFYRARQTEKISGTGLGLRSAKALSMPTAAGSGLNSALVAAVFLLLPCL